MTDSPWDKLKWGSKNVAMWMVLIICIFIIAYLVLILLQSQSKMGEVCMKNTDCKSNFCYIEDGRHMRYCTDRCSSDKDCPPGWKCLRPPYMPQGMYICLRP